MDEIKLLNIRRAAADGNHNAFTDLITFNGNYYLTFRKCPDGHMLFSTSEVVIMRSTNSQTWEEVQRFHVPGRDVRDPHFLIFQGRLFVYSGAWPVTEGDPKAKDFSGMQGYVSWSDDGYRWSDVQAAPGTGGTYIWRAAAYQDRAYLCGRRYQPSQAGLEPGSDIAGHKGLMLASSDGLHWEDKACFRPEDGNETAFVFEADGTVVALARSRDKSRGAYLCRARPPYTDWYRKELKYNLGGPLLVRWNERYMAAGRWTREDDGPKTAIFWLEDDELLEAAVLPSGGDTSYPGFVKTGPGTGLFSYYSTHEGSTNVYLAELALPTS